MKTVEKNDVISSPVIFNKCTSYFLEFHITGYGVVGQTSMCNMDDAVLWAFAFPVTLAGT